ncbi:MAG: LAGLIDADG family homing endonuclease [Candidatus Thorarchaeota archaeon]|nr:LAGLIDADG family homing endonuclease [Candidatus Thorarchaeota archaeon]
MTDGQKRRPQTKTYIPIDAEWLFDAPKEWMIRFVQGLADGDGSVSLKNAHCTITSLANPDFIQRILAKVNLNAKVYGLNVTVRGNDQIVAAEQLPFFWGTTAKREKLALLVEWLKKPPPPEKKRYTREELEVLSEAITWEWSIETTNNAIYAATCKENRGTGWYRSPTGLIHKLRRMREARIELLREVLEEAQQRHWSQKMVSRTVRDVSKERLGYIWEPQEADIEREKGIMNKERNDED